MSDDVEALRKAVTLLKEKNATLEGKLTGTMAESQALRQEKREDEEARAALQGHVKQLETELEERKNEVCVFCSTSMTLYFPCLQCSAAKTNPPLHSVEPFENLPTL